MPTVSDATKIPTTIGFTAPIISVLSTTSPICSPSRAERPSDGARWRRQGLRWCAGCHDVVPFLSGAFDDPEFDIRKHPTAHGITYAVCHAITHVNSTKGNAAYTLEEPIHYPFAKSENPLLRYANEQMIKAKPAFHKKTFLKPLHENAEFCSTCHKVSLPGELTHYKDWLRGQNHYDSFLLSGVSGGNARAFYFPPKAQVIATVATCRPNHPLILVHNTWMKAVHSKSTTISFRQPTPVSRTCVKRPIGSKSLTRTSTRATSRSSFLASRKAGRWMHP